MSDPIKGLREISRKKGLPPLEQWNPPFCGDIPMEIKRDGTWFYQGTPIGRFSLVQLFASILWREDDEYFLVTPVEKVRIQVEDVPFIANGMQEKENALHFETNLQDNTILRKRGELLVNFADDGEPLPYVLIRRNLWARLDRKEFFRLVDMAVYHEDYLGVWSSGIFHPIAYKDRLG